MLSSDRKPPRQQWFETNTTDAVSSSESSDGLPCTRREQPKLKTESPSRIPPIHFQRDQFYTTVKLLPSPNDFHIYVSTDVYLCSRTGARELPRESLQHPGNSLAASAYVVKTCTKNANSVTSSLTGAAC